MDNIWTVLKKLGFGLVTAAVTLTVIGGCSSEKVEAESRQGVLKIVTTTGMVADLVKNVGGEFVQVEALMGAGVDPHLYKASPGDISKINAADVVFYSGLHLEGKMADILEELAKKKPVFAVAEEIPSNILLDSETTAGFPDPHIWFDIELWSKTLDIVAQNLSEVAPEHSDTFELNASNYEAELLELDEEVRNQINTIPENSRVMITAHDAFRYFGRAYDIEVLGIQGISTESEAGLKEINNLVDVIVDRKVKAVFVETSVSQKNVQALVEGAQQRGANVSIGGQLFSDAMGTEGTPEGTYVGMLRHNVKTIVEALK